MPDCRGAVTSLRLLFAWQLVTINTRCIENLQETGQSEWKEFRFPFVISAVLSEAIEALVEWRINSPCAEPKRRNALFQMQSRKPAVV